MRGTHLHYKENKPSTYKETRVPTTFALIKIFWWIDWQQIENTMPSGSLQRKKQAES